MSDDALEPKRWKLARALVWSSIVLSAAVFWLVVGTSVVEWLR